MSESKEELKKAEEQAAEMLASLEVPADALVGESNEHYKIRRDRESINQSKKS